MSARGDDTPIEALTPAQAKKELARVAREIARHDRLYYQDSATVLSDAEYDALRRRNEALEARFPDLVRADSPSHRVGAPPDEGFAKVTHARPVLSLGNAFEGADLEEFVGRVRRFLKLDPEQPVALVGEPKIDGLSATACASRMAFSSGGATRGDGVVGGGHHRQPAHARRYSRAP